MMQLVKAIKAHSGLDKKDIVQAGEYGADAGWSGFSYYGDTADFYDNHEDLIWELLEQEADDQGVSINELIGSFRTRYDSLATFKNLLSWFALEEAGRWLADEDFDD